ncbi:MULTISPECIES: DEAD/DEAH box helicase [Pantoea]|uniref:DEAD/DEAH box helicase n=1 Tax=Candidatus Pantoea gossypiicola TaxID=2608008 RepID=A0AB34CUY5_9GAMM|nr:MULTISPECIES: DEAD/DEAH box helicase [Pantoea]KAA5961038.1 DEAD/DEAH box helicase [Pantoea sp. VH_24]KAA5964421.1 DEAD/DEAH box helicase [Pantoea sp. VH_16]KAA5968641.1 DEAD/DEAH box helicase [Pantoea sp. VH_18]KAA6004292.1 DEAD/DEAH box helicase [Pantoea sp. M_1]KAA6006776.1 DEAD/DEAH box helicase [Pantoea sp. F_7]
MLSIQPREKQVVALNMLRAAWKQHGSFMLYAPVGFGKTAIAALITHGFVSRGLRVMFVAPYTVLLDQTASRFVEYGLPEDEISYVWRDHPSYFPQNLIQIASADTLIRRKFPDNIDLLIVDEAHLRRKQLLKVIEYLTQETNVKVVGLSGTPFAKFLGNYYQKLIKPTTMKELIEIGALSPYEFYAPSHPDLTGVKTSVQAGYGSDYNEEQIGKIMSAAPLVGDIVRNWLENGQNRPTICFCVNVAHANFVTMEFSRAGVAVEVMTAHTPHDQRQLTIRRFEQGITKIIVNVGVLVAGFDSDVRCIIFARPTKSEIRWIQTLGRGLRPAPGKEQCLIFDHTGTVSKLGYPDDIEYDYLPADSDGMETAPVRVSRVEEPEQLPKECPSCHYVKPVGIYICPKCGFKPLAGEDVETDRSRGLSRVKKEKVTHTKEQKQSWWSQILYYQRIRSAQGKPVSDGWCAHTYRQKFQVWPQGLHRTPMEITPEVSNFIKSKQIAYVKGKQKQEGKAA